MTTQQQLVDKLRPLGVRLTPQRLAIAEVVVNSADHPSVRDIYDRVRAFFPYVTIATVYSTLNMLEELGIVRELPFQRQSRYDANLSPHVNLVCLTGLKRQSMVILQVAIFHYKSLYQLLNFL